MCATVNMDNNDNNRNNAKIAYERPLAVTLGSSSDLILGGSKYYGECCSCKWGT
jgi:hypothetical protein